MEEKRVNHLEQIPPEDWGKTPTSVKKLVEAMAQQIEQQEKKLTEVLTVQEQLLEKINRTSENSSSPPSSDPPGFGKKSQKTKSGKKRGGQPGHKGNSRDLYPIEECSQVIEHHPQECSNCGATMTGVDTNPYRHQIVEIPPISPIVIEHRLHQLTCSGCGTLDSCQITLRREPKWLRSQSSGSSSSIEWSIPPQSKNGTKCHATSIWDFNIIGNSQQTETGSK